ncbi:alpha/beta fold hydrolase [uncultured Croceitalea sp.]|uniref:alpha/beta hydrolase family protein n=1 Tax=uncultured Croceitalea sp. TaxID=1798908 RepID=UPI003306772A
MKKIAMLFMLFCSFAMSSQEIVGDWSGTLKTQGMELRLVFHISEANNIHSGTLDSPDQKAFGIPISSINLKNSKITISLDKLRAIYNGTLGDSGIIIGTFNQGGQSFKLNLSKDKLTERVLERPQEPKKPFPYYSEDVTFLSEGGSVKLSGTLTLPSKNGKFPVAILISGSGPQNRDEEYMTHKPFLVLSDYLTRKGIAVLRYDDRGFGESTGNHNTATSLDFAFDVKCAINYLRTRDEINKNQIGLIGHSEGGLIAPIVASEMEEVDFMVLLAGPGVSGSEVVLQQLKATAELNKMTSEELEGETEFLKGIIKILSRENKNVFKRQQLKTYFKSQLSELDDINGMNKAEYIDSNIAQLMRPWYLYYIKHEPSKYLKQVKCPVFAINGSKDSQVVPENLNFIESALKVGGNKDVTIKEYEEMNHLFQKCETGAISEYASISITMDSQVLDDISKWILKMVNE